MQKALDRAKSMRRISEKIVRILLCGTLAVMTAFFFQPCSAPAAEKASGGEDGGLSIEIVEELSIDDQITIEGNSYSKFRQTDKPDQLF